MYHAHPFAGLALMFFVWVVQLLIAYLIYRDAKEQKMLAPVWVILAILPVFGYFIDVFYLLIREVRLQRTDKPPVTLEQERTP
jgi:uncharacterized membrane protein